MHSQCRSTFKLWLWWLHRWDWIRFGCVDLWFLCFLFNQYMDALLTRYFLKRCKILLEQLGDTINITLGKSLLLIVQVLSPSLPRPGDASTKCRLVGKTCHNDARPYNFCHRRRCSRLHHKSSPHTTSRLRDTSTLRWLDEIYSLLHVMDNPRKKGLFSGGTMIHVVSFPH